MSKTIRAWAGLNKYSKDMFEAKYFLPDEDYDGWLMRVSSAYSDDEAHAERIRGYIKKYWFMPSTPVASNAGVPERGLPISCYVNEVPDSKEGIFGIFEENNWLGSFGGGIGTVWSFVRGLGEKVGLTGKSGGVVPFLKVSDSSTLAVSQGGLRRASQAVYLDVRHPEILEFIDIRRPTGDTDRRCQNIHHAVVFPNAFMRAVVARELWDIVSPKTGEVLKTVDAFDLHKKILIARMETGEPYILYSDRANELAPQEYKDRGYKIKTSNLCSEIMLHTSEDKTGVCCLVSMNLEYFDEFRDDEQFFKDIHRFTDNVLQSFIELTEGLKGFEKARASAMEERSLGIGVMGYHSMLQKMNLPYNSIGARAQTNIVFSTIDSMFKLSNSDRKNWNVTAVAPTASISILCDLASPGIDPRLSNIYVEKTDIGSYTLKNKYLDAILHDKANAIGGTMEEREAWVEHQWDLIRQAGGSVQDLDSLTDDEKDVFKTAHEIDQRAIIEAVAIMTPHIDQGISTNLFLRPDINAQLLYDLHILAWKKGLKSLYYVRSKSVKRATVGEVKREKLEQSNNDLSLETDTCLGCA